MSERDDAHAFLLASDPAMAALAAAHGPVDPYVWADVPPVGGPDDLFGGLALGIVAQQISTAAMLAIFGRLRTLLGGTITPEGVAELSQEQLLSVGLSHAKARTLHQLAEAVLSGAFDPGALRELSDEEAERALVTLRGIGPWSAQMFLLHELRRPDVFPAGDVALRGGLAALLDLPLVPSIEETRERASVWAPYRSYAAAHLWRGLGEVR